MKTVEEIRNEIDKIDATIDERYALHYRYAQLLHAIDAEIEELEAKHQSLVAEMERKTAEKTAKPIIIVFGD